MALGTSPLGKQALGKTSAPAAPSTPVLSAATVTNITGTTARPRVTITF